MSANSFLQGFTGGMGTMNQMIDSAEQRRQQKKDREDQESLRTFSSLMHGYNQMDGDQKTEFQAQIADKMNNDPAIRDVLSRNVGYNEQKRISPTLGEFTRDGFVPMIEVVDGRTGQVIRNGPLTEFGNSDGSDSPVAISTQDLMTSMGSYLGKDNFGQQLEMQILEAGGSLPEKKDTFRQEKLDGRWMNINNNTNEAKSLGAASGASGAGGGGSLASEKPIQTWDVEGENGTIKNLLHKVGNEYVRTQINPDGGFQRRAVTGDWNKWQEQGIPVPDPDPTPDPTPDPDPAPDPEVDAGMTDKNKSRLSHPEKMRQSAEQTRNRFEQQKNNVNTVQKGFAWMKSNRDAAKAEASKSNDQDRANFEESISHLSESEQVKAKMSRGMR